MALADVRAVGAETTDGGERPPKLGLEEHDDVAKVFANFDIDADAMAEAEG